MGLREPMSPLKWCVECFIAGGGVGVSFCAFLREPCLSGDIQSGTVSNSVKNLVLIAMRYKIGFT